MKIGVLLPTFRSDASDALRVASEVAEGGLDGVFCYDHLWPMGTPTRPALAPFSLLATIARRETSLSVGPLVARVGLGGVSRLEEQLTTLVALAPGRVIAALGTGDALSRGENEAYGLAYDSAEVRREELARIARALRDEAEVWIGGGSDATNDVARALGVTLNVWNTPPARVAALASASRVTWAGDLVGDVAGHLDELAAAGAAWAVASTNVALGPLYEWRRARGISSVV